MTSLKSSAPVARRYPVQFVSFADVQKDPGLHFKAGGPASERTLNVLLGKNVQAGRIMAGVTFSTPGNWTSWPPHEHAALAEEAYLYIDMPAPAFGVQLVYTDKTTPELAVIVREGDVVLMPKGYHPNVAAPGGPINFLWMMAANRETEDRLFGVVNVHPDFAQGGSGLEAGRHGEKLAMGDTVSAPYQTWNWDTIPREHIGEGIVRQMVYGETLMICRLTLAPGTITAAHDHVHEQMTIVEKGRVRFVLGSEEKISVLATSCSSRAASGMVRRCSTRRSSSLTSSRPSGRTFSSRMATKPRRRFTEATGSQEQRSNGAQRT